MAQAIAQYLDGKKAEQIVILDISGPFVIADYFVVATVDNTRQGQAIAKDLDGIVKQQRGRRRRNTGGMETGSSSWVLLDFDEIIVHLFLAESRAFYGLEELWADAPRVAFEPWTPKDVPAGW
jgi:ribosome-associated protein